MAAIDPQPGETFVEIGPGRGALTRPLAERARRVIAYEIDRDLAAELRASMPENVTIVEGDFLNQEPGTQNAGPLRVAGNLPYNVASPILFRLVEWSRRGVPLTDATVMLQREVADRLAAAPGTREYGVLTVLIGHRAAVQRILTLPPGAFRPPPKVQSAVVRLRFHPPDPPAADEAAFERVVQHVFTKRRKTLTNALAGLPVLAAGVDGRRRPETLSIAEFVQIANSLSNNA